MNFFKIIPRFFPQKLREKLVILAGSVNAKDPEVLIGMLFSAAIITSLIFGLAISLLTSSSFLLVTFGVLFLMFSSIYFYFVLKSDLKVKFIEELLPDALQLTASNLRAGISIEKALLLAARPEFGPLETEIHRVAKEVATGKDFGNALKEMNKRIKSKSLGRVVDLIISGLRSGGKLSDLLENSAEDLRTQKIVRQKIRSNVEIYIIFIFVAAGIGAPILFSLSLFLVKVMIQNFGNIELPTSATTALPITIGKVQTTPAFIQKYILVSLSTTSVLASFMLGMISKGRSKEGIKYIILLASISIALFFITGLLLQGFFSGLFGS